MPSQIVFPCPSCGASQSVDDTAATAQCQFCGSTIAVPENLRPKPVTPDPAQAAPQPFSFGGSAGLAPMGGLPGMTGLPNMFLNMDIGKLRDMAMAARTGDKATAARLYSEAFGVGPEQAMQAAELMSSHHHLVLNQMQMDSSPMIQMSVGSSGPTFQPGPSPLSGTTYSLPSPPVRNQGSGSRWVGCVVAVATAILVIAILGVITFAMLRAR